MADNENAVTPTPENPIPDVDEIKPGIPTPAWPDEGGGGGTGGGVLMVGISGDDGLTMDKTFGEIKNAILTTAIVFQYVVNGGGALSVTPYTLVGLADAPDGKVIAMLNNGEPLMFSAETDNDYPTTGR